MIKFIIILIIIGFIVFLFEEYPITPWIIVVGVCVWLYFFVFSDAIQNVVNIILCIVLICTLFSGLYYLYGKFRDIFKIKFDNKAKEIIRTFPVLEQKEYYQVCSKNLLLNIYFNLSNYKGNSGYNHVLSTFFEEEKKVRLEKYIINLILNYGGILESEIIEHCQYGKIKNIFPYKKEEICCALKSFYRKDIDKVKLNDEQVLYINKSLSGKKIKSTIIEM